MVSVDSVLVSDRVSSSMTAPSRALTKPKITRQSISCGCHRPAATITPTKPMLVATTAWRETCSLSMGRISSNTKNCDENIRVVASAMGKS